MISITILGANCPHCESIERHVRTAMRWLAPQDGYEISHITDKALISNYADKTPALMIDGEVVCEGCIPAPQQIVTWASLAMQTALKQATMQQVPVKVMSDAAYGK